jgi:hypothetical protein
VFLRPDPVCNIIPERLRASNHPAAGPSFLGRLLTIAGSLRSAHLSTDLPFASTKPADAILAKLNRLPVPSV